MTEPVETRPAGRPGLIAGPVLLVLGSLAAWLATDFDAESRPFPLALGGLVAVSGVGILVQAFVSVRRDTFRPDGQAQVLVAVVLMGLWALAFGSGLGFVMPTFGLQLGLLWLSGVRAPLRVTGLAAVITLLAWLLFVFLLDIPLPPSLLPDGLQRF